MRSTFAFIVGVGLMVAAPLAQAPASKPAQGKTAKTLDIYVIDVEGGKATLFVSPTGETVLLDSGNPGAARSGTHHVGADRRRASSRSITW